MTRTVPFRHRAISSLVATAVLALGVAAAPASALISHPSTDSGRAGSLSPPPCGDVCSGHGYGFVSPQPPSAHVTSGGGFDFGDAAIGAAGGVALSMFVLGGGLVAARRHTRRSESATA